MRTVVLASNINAGAGHLPESGLLYVNTIRAGIEIGEREEAAFVGGFRAAEVGVDLGKVDGNRGNDRVGSIRNGTKDGPLEESVPGRGETGSNRAARTNRTVAENLLRFIPSPLFIAIVLITISGFRVSVNQRRRIPAYW